MNFEESPAEAAFRAEVRAWIDANGPREIADKLKQGGSGGLDDDARFAASKAWQKKKADAGWACLKWPKEYGGGAYSPIEQVIWNQEEGIYNALGGPFMVGVGMCAPTLMVWGTEEDKRRFLPKVASGEEIWCQLFSEPSGGSDVAGLRTRAERADDGSGDWIINGQKIWTSYAHRSDWGLLIARSDPTVPKHKGITAFYVSMKAPGVETRRIKQMTGASHFNEVFFSDVRIPDSQRLGAPGQGWEVSITTLMNERASIGSNVATGFNELLNLCKAIDIDGRPAVEDPAVRSKLAQFAVQDSGLRYNAMRSISALSKGATPGPENSITKLVSASLTQEMGMYGLDLLGAAGVVTDPDFGLDTAMADMVMRSPSSRIAGGTDEILRNIIAERVLGLPGDVRVDKNVPFKDIPTRGSEVA